MPTAPHRRARRGLTLIEIMVVIAIIGIVVGVGVPALSGLLALQQQQAISELGQTYIWLRDEAALRNVTFRVVYNLDLGTWKVEAGDASTLIFSDPEARQKYDEELREKMDRFTERELEEGAGEELAPSRFEGLDDSAFTTTQTLPSGLRFAFVYTPQYGRDGVVPSDDVPEEEADQAIAYSYIFPDGSAEHTIIRIVDEDDPRDGYTLQLEPLTGTVSITNDEIDDPEDVLGWLPQDGPQLR
jgi:prepilin-type N-terminal cleavage/methylation domain-containing protein